MLQKICVIRGVSINIQEEDDNGVPIRKEGIHLVRHASNFLVPIVDDASCDVRMFMYLNSNGIPDTHAHPHQIDIHTNEVDIHFSTRQLLSLTKVLESFESPESGRPALPASTETPSTLLLNQTSPLRNCH